MLPQVGTNRKTSVVQKEYILLTVTQAQAESTVETLFLRGCMDLLI